MEMMLASYDSIAMEPYNMWLKFNSLIMMVQAFINTWIPSTSF